VQVLSKAHAVQNSNSTLPSGPQKWCKIKESEKYALYKNVGCHVTALQQPFTV
jgi:hypothetical protein